MSNYLNDNLLLPSRLTGALLALRILVGWHLLYEGLAKLFNPAWSSAGFLIDSTWILSGIFRSMAASATVVKAVDLANIWGLILIGLALMLGSLTRLSAVCGGGLLALYYLAQPPLIGFDVPTVSEGSYLIVNKNLIEIAVMLLFALLPSTVLPGLDQWLFRRRRTAAEVPVAGVPEDENLSPLPAGSFPRRELITSLVALPVLGAFVLAVLKKRSFEESQLKAFKGDAVSSASARSIRMARLADLKGKVPAGKIGKLDISRVICGGNLVSGFAHSRDLIYVSPLLKTYFSDEKVIETLRLCEACGINTALLRTDPNTIRILSKYWKRGGTIQWLAQTYPKPDNPTENIRMALDNGAMGAMVQGGIADLAIEKNQFSFLARSLEYIKKQGVIAGTAAHSIQVPMQCEKAGLDVDFYMKTLHHDRYWSAHPTENRSDRSINGENLPDHQHFHDNMWCMNSEETVAFMSTVKKPWIAYKILAAGAIPPKDGFRFAFQSGADFACVGMFDFQVVENANLVREVLNEDLRRARTWFA